MKKIVTIGGGTGSYTVLSGLKNLKDVSLTALVNMSDNGGSTGVLRDELGVLPPGDVRQCLVALSEHTPIVRELMSYRFSEGGLSGHSFGNIFLAALEKVTGDFAEGVEVASEILKVTGDVIPVTRDKAQLAALLQNGNLVQGVIEIDAIDFEKTPLDRIFYKEEIKLNEKAKTALLNADYIIVGPGNFYCSIIPSLVINGFQEALKESKAKIIFPINLTNKKEHTKDWKASDHMANMEKYLGKKVDIILINNEPPSPEQVERYRLTEGRIMIEDDLNDQRVVRDSLISHSFFTYDKTDKKQNIRSFIRHDSDKLAKCIEKIINSQ